jgi:hypothetical protein
MLFETFSTPAPFFPKYLHLINTAMVAVCCCQASDPSLIKDPKSLQDVWLFKLPREAPTKAYMLIK